MTDIIRLAKHNAQLQENTTLMGTDVIASLITQDAGAFPTAQIRKTIYLIFVQRFKGQQMCMSVPIMLTNRSCCNGTMAVSTVMEKFFHQGLIERKAWDALVPKVHSKIRSVTYGHNLVLRSIEQETHTFVDMITETIKVSELLRTVSTDGVTISRITERVV